LIPIPTRARKAVGHPREIHYLKTTEVQQLNYSTIWLNMCTTYKQLTTHLSRKPHSPNQFILQVCRGRLSKHTWFFLPAGTSVIVSTTYWWGWCSDCQLFVCLF